MKASTRLATSGRELRRIAVVLGLVSLNVDIIVASASQAALAAKTLTQTVPIVFAGIIDPVDIGLVSNLSRPGGNITARA